MSKRFRSRVAVALALVLIAAFVGACGGDDDKPKTTTTPVASTAASSGGASRTATATPNGSDETSTATAQANPADVFNACSLLTKSEIESELGGTVGDGERNDYSPFSDCEWTESGLTYYMRTSVFAADSSEALDLYYNLTAGQDVSGFGDKAQWDASLGLEIAKGDYDLTLDIVGSDETEDAELAHLKALADKALDRMP